VQQGDLDGICDRHSRDIVMFDVPSAEEGVRGLDAYRAVWPDLLDWVRAGARFELVELNVIAGHDVACAWALLRCGSDDELQLAPSRRLRLTFGLRRDEDGWRVTHEHHSFTHRCDG
jgi:ketosteroid isomerase-like protein